MKGYEFWILSAFLTLLISMCSPLSVCGASLPQKEGRNYSFVKNTRGKGRRSRENGSFACSSVVGDGSGSFYMRSTCKEGGYVTVVANKVLLQTSGLNISHPEAEFMKETCSWSSLIPGASSLVRQPLVRYRHQASGKYICFSKAGKIRTVNERRVDKKGNMCVFKENILEYEYTRSRTLASTIDSSTYHTIQSAHKNGWMLGFNPKKGVRIPDRAPHRGSLPRRGSKSPKSRRKCGFRFHSGAHQPIKSIDKHRGLFKLIEEKTDSDLGSSVITKADSRGEDERLEELIPLLSPVERELIAQQQRLGHNRDKMRKKVRLSRQMKNSRRKRNGRNKSVIRTR